MMPRRGGEKLRLIESNSVLMTEDKVYPIQDVRGAVMDVKYWMPQSGKAVFQLIFPPIDCKTDKLTFGESGWRIEDIDLSNLQSIEEYCINEPRLADGEYRIAGVSNMPSQDGVQDNKQNVLEKAQSLIPTLQVAGDQIIVKGNPYKDFVKPGIYNYTLLDDKLVLTSKDMVYTLNCELIELMGDRSLLMLKYKTKIDKSEIIGLSYIREE